MIMNLKAKKLYLYECISNTKPVQPPFQKKLGGYVKCKFSLDDSASMISKNNCGLGPQHAFPPSVGSSGMSLSPQTLAAYLDVVDKWLFSSHGRVLTCRCKQQTVFTDWFLKCSWVCVMKRNRKDVQVLFTVCQFSFDLNNVESMWNIKCISCRNTVKQGDSCLQTQWLL